MEGRKGTKRLEGLSEKIFLDRYALKAANGGGAMPGDVVLVTTKEDTKFPSKEVGEVIAREGERVRVRLRSGEIVDVESSASRIQLTAETEPEQMWDRLAGVMAAVEREPDKVRLWKERFRYALDDWKLVPGGRIAAGAGAGDELTLFNCYVIPSPEDSRGGIMRTLSEMTEIMSRGGGVGINLSTLRPRHTIVAGVNGKSSGAVSWGGLFSYATGLIEQGGSRRGALMLMLNDWHPDLLEFVTVKQQMGEVTNANLSVCVSNGFMKAVKEDLDWELVFPDTKDPEYDELWRGDLADWRNRGKRVVTHQTMKARDIWHTIIESAWKSAEPGVVFMERYNEMSNSWYFNPIISTNPCFHPDTRISTEYGLIRIEDLAGKVGEARFLTATDNRLVEAARIVGGRSYEIPGVQYRSATVFATGKKTTVAVVLKNGMEIKVTADHRLYTDSGWKEAGKLQKEDMVYIQSGKGVFAMEDELGEQWGLFLGWLTGDGWISKRGDIGMVFGKDDQDALRHILDAAEAITGTKAKVYERENGTKQVLWWKKSFLAKLLEIGVKPVKAAEKRVPSTIFTSTERTVTAFLQALFSSDGTVYEGDEMHRTVRLTSVSKGLLQDVQLLLLNYGVHGRIYARKKTNQRLFEYVRKSDGQKKTHNSQPLYELIISGNNLVVFKEQIGFKLVSRKQEALKRIARPSRKQEKFVSQVESVVPNETVMVYDISEPVTHSLIASGFVAHNCGEQGLPAWGVCNLSAINLSKFYDEKADDVNWEELAKVTRWGVRFLDNVIDATPYHFEENERNQKRERRIGLGSMGLAELMIKLGIRYGSAESLQFLDKLYGFIAREAYLASAEIAAEKGSFEAFDKKLFVQSGFMRNMLERFPEVGEAIEANGMRNVTVLTQAPTGSTGTMVGTSTGIEPYFAFEYYRQSRLGFDKQLVPIAAEWLAEHPGEELPEYFVTAMDLSAQDHIRVQAAIQRWVDSSISKTANAPHEFTVEETKELYELAYELGCKGVTIYRDGSRDVQVLTAKKEDSTEEEKASLPAEKSSVAIEAAAGEALAGPGGPGGAAGESHDGSQSGKVIDNEYKRRPQVLRGATYKLNTPFGMAYITINDIDGTPGEIFLNVGKAGSDVFAMAEALGRVCSLFLRYGNHGNKVKLLIKHLKGIGGTGAIGFGANRVESIADAVAKALEMHTEAGSGDSAAYASAAVGGDGNGTPAAPAGVSQGHASGGRASLDLCPSCGAASLINIEGCKQCTNCGYSRCN